MTTSERGRGSIVAGFVGNAVGSPVVMLFTLGVFTKPIEDDLGWTRSEVSFAATIFTLVTALTLPLVGALLDRFGPRRVVLVSLPAFAAAYASLALLPRNLAAFYALWAAITMLGAGTSPVPYAKAISSCFDRRLGLAMGIAVAGQGVGAAILPAVAHVAIARLGWRDAYAVIGAAAFVPAFATCALFLRSAPPTRAAREESGAGLRAVRTMPFAILAAAFFLLGVMSTAILTHQVPMLIDRGMTSGKAAGAQVVYGVTLTFGRLFVGAALDRFFAPRVLMTSLCGVVLGLLGYASGASGAAAFVCAALVGFGVGAEVDALGYIVARYFARGAYGRIYALVLACFTLGGGIGAAALGAIRTAHGTYTPGLWLIAAATTLAIAVLSRLQRSSETRELSQIARAQTV